MRYAAALILLLSLTASAGEAMLWSNGHGNGQYGSCAAACNAIGMPFHRDKEGANRGGACYPTENHYKNGWATASCIPVQKSCDLKAIKGKGPNGSHPLAFPKASGAPTMQRRCQNNCEVEYQRIKKEGAATGSNYGGLVCIESPNGTKIGCTGDYTALQTGSVCIPKPGEKDDTKYNEVNNQPDGGNDPGASDDGKGNPNGGNDNKPDNPGQPPKPGQGHDGSADGGAGGSDAGGNPGGGQGGTGSDSKGDSGTADNPHHGGVGGGGGGGHHGGGGGGGSGHSGSGSGSGASGGGSGGTGDGGSGDGKGDGKGSISGGDCKNNKAPVCKGDPIQCYIAKEQWRTACLAERGHGTVTGGSCKDNKPPECKGDATQCYIVKQQFYQGCAAAQDKADRDAAQGYVDANAKTIGEVSGSSMGDAGKGLEGNSQRIDLGKTLDLGGYGWSRTCPALPTVDMGKWGIFAMDSAPFCTIAQLIGNLLVAISLIFSVRYVFS